MQQKILIAGSSGFVGSALVGELRSRGHRVIRLVREGSGAADDPDSVDWRPAQARLPEQAVDGVDVVINLAGRSIAAGRWSERVKAELVRSRLDATRTLAAAIAGVPSPPRLFLNSSATGFYGDRGELRVDEESPPADDFLATLAKSWEDAAIAARSPRTQVTLLRLGMVIGRGGALQKMLLPFRLGLGGPLGSGRQWWPWIAMQDVLGAVVHLIEREAHDGPVNLVSPDEVRCREFSERLGRAVHRPAILPAPAFALRLLLGEMADALLLASTRVHPGVLTEKLAFEYRCPDLDDALGLAQE